MTTKHSADSDVQYETRYPLSNDPNDPNKAPNRKRYVVNGRVQCSACKEWKLFEEFHKSKNLAYGICGICKVCARKRSSENYFKHKENSKFRDENGEYIKNGGELIKRYKHKEHKTPDNMKKNWEQNVWLFSNTVGRIQYGIGLFKNKEDAEQFIQDKVDEQEAIIEGTKNKLVIRKANKEIQKWQSFVLLKYALRKLITNKEKGDDE